MREGGALHGGRPDSRIHAARLLSERRQRSKRTMRVDPLNHATRGWNTTAAASDGDCRY